jgi:glycosyltransferase involved in cell wall biosynthesis
MDVRVAHWTPGSWGGGEYVATRLAEVFGQSEVLSFGSPEGPNPYGDIAFRDITDSLSYPRIRRLQQRVDRVFEYAMWEDVDWREFGNPDVLITSGSTTRAVITPESTTHVNYCHSPPRWLYDLYHDRKQSLVGTISRPLIRYLRMRDISVDPRVDRYVANSPVVQERIRSFWNRDSTVVYPPIDTDSYWSEPSEGFYLHIGRTDIEKGVMDVVSAFQDSDAELKMIGSIGSWDPRDEISDHPNIEWLGFVSEREKRSLLAQCEALIFNGIEEDFGIVPIEALASRKPVLVRSDGGFPSQVIDDGINGYHHDGSPAGIRNAMRRLEDGELDVEATDVFDISHFEEQMREVIT